MIKRPRWDQHDWRGPQERRKPARPATLAELQLEALMLFNRIQRQFGLETARRVFADFAEEPTKTQRDYLEKLQWLERLDAMPRPNKRQLTREVLEGRGIAPTDRGYQNKFDNLYRQIRRAESDRAKIEAMHGPISPPVAKGEVPSFRIIPRRDKK
jgi:hypothetical protein